MTFDNTFIGSGPGGYVGAIRSAQLGFKTALIEKEPTFGGTCLNVGCIPTKTLLELSGMYYEAVKKFGRVGIEIDGIKLDYLKMLKRKETVVSQNGKGIQALLQKEGVEVIKGFGSLESANSILVQNEADKITIESKNTIIATGSVPFSLPFVKFDGQKILSSSDILSLDHVPETLAIIGAGVIGLELGSVFARLGTKVSVFEITPSVLPYYDSDVCKEVTRSMKKLGLKLFLNHRVTKVELDGSKVRVEALDAKEKNVEVLADYCLSAVGRKPNTEGLNLENLGIHRNPDGSIVVNENLQTGCENIYAIGDAIGGMMLAHKASEEAIFVAELLAGKTQRINYKAIPAVVYTAPEVASVGITEEQMQDMGIAYKVGVCQNRALGRAHTADKLEGFAKVILEEGSYIIRGVHLVAPHASEMIGEAVVAVEKEMTAEELAHASHAHPTFQEAIKEACMLAAEGKAIHAR